MISAISLYQLRAEQGNETRPGGLLRPGTGFLARLGGISEGAGAPGGAFLLVTFAGAYADFFMTPPKDPSQHPREGRPTDHQAVLLTQALGPFD